jgi:hypothetical protein
MGLVRKTGSTKLSEWRVLNCLSTIVEFFMTATKREMLILRLANSRGFQDAILCFEPVPPKGLRYVDAILTQPF